MALAAGAAVQLDRRDWGLIAVAVVVAAISLGIVSRYFHRAFPEASIDFQVSGAGSAPVAEHFLAAQGLSVAGFRHAEQFGYDDTAKTFLERELGLARSEELLRSRLQLWRWENRWFKPLDKEEFQVEVSTAGPVVGFDHTVADDAPGASLSEDQARQRAQQFLGSVMHQDWAAWTAVGSEREVKPHRVDYVFTWKDTAPLEPQASGAVAQAEHRHVVRVQGDRIGAYSEYLKVPDQWTRDFSRLRSKNDSAGLVDSGLLLIVFVAMLFVLVMRIRRGDIRWRTALWVGGAGAVLSFLAALNSLGAARFSYDTTQSWSSFVAGNIFSAIAAAVGTGVFFVVLTATAESLYRERFPEHVAVGGFLSWRGVRSKSFLISMVLGLSLAAFFFAYQTVFYLVANHFGAWAPADIPYDDLLNTKLPWAFVLFSGFFPAISEEFGFRMLAIPLFEKWFRWLWVAVIAASFLWGFGHATYPNEPWFIRGVEVGSGGVLLSWIMIRYGILATVVWHYTVDALYTAMLLLRAHDAYLRWSGATTAFLAVAPLLVAIVAYRHYHGFASEAGITNAAEGTAMAEAPAAGPPTGGVGEASEPPPLAAYQPIPGANWTAGLIIAAALLSAFAVPTARWDSVLPWRVSRTEAVSRAQAFLARQGFSTAGYRAAVTLGSATEAAHGESNQVAAADIFARRGQRPLLHAFSGPEPTVAAAYWEVRFFRPLQQDEYDVALRPDTGRVIAFSHVQPQTAPGGAPSLAEAQRAAATFLAAQGIATAAMAIKTAVQIQRAARIDSTFVWEASGPPAPQPLAGEVAYRVAANLAGNRVSYFDAWYHVPEAQVRAYEEGTLLGTILGVLQGLLLAAVIGLIAYFLYRFARQHGLAWATLLKISAAGGVVMLLMDANGLPATLAGYPTATPWSAFLLSAGIGLVVSGQLGFLATLVLLAPLAITAPQTTALTVANARRHLEHETAWDALWVGVLALAWLLGWARVQAVINTRWHAAGTAALASPPSGLTQYVPGLSDVLAAPLHAFWIAAFLGILLPVLWRAWRTPRDRGWCIAAVGLIWIGSFPSVHHPLQFAPAAIFSAINLALLFGFAHLFLRDNALAYLSAALLPGLVAPALGWLGMAQPNADWIGAVLLGLALAWVAWLAAMSKSAERAAGMRE